VTCVRICAQAPAQLSLGDALEPGSLEIVRLDASLGGGPLGQQPLEDATRHPDHAAVLADLDPEFHRLLVGIPSRVLGEGKEHRRLRSCSGVRRMFSKRS